MTEVSLKKLIGLSVKRKTSSKVFVSLFNQLNERSPVTEDEFLDTFLNYPGNEEEAAKAIEYCIKTSLSSETNMARLWNLMSKLKVKQQVKILKEVNKILLKEGKLSTKLQACMIESIIKYSGSVMSEGTLVYQSVLLLGSIVKKWHLIDGETKVILSNFIDTLDASSYKDLSRFLIKNSGQSLGKFHAVKPSEASHNIVNTNQLSKDITMINSNSSKFNELNNLKSYLWLYDLMENWSFSKNQIFVNSYEKLFCSSSKSKNKHTSIVNMVESIFNGFVTSLTNQAPSYIIYNWKIFIITKLPDILLKVASPKSIIQDAIKDCFKAFDDVTNKTLSTFNWSNSIFDIRRIFIKHCIYAEVLPLEFYFEQFPEDGDKFNSTILNNEKNFTIKSIEDELTIKLLEINSEFTSLVESGLIEYINQLPDQIRFQPKYQQELTVIINKIIDSLIEEKNIEKLNRLIIAITNNYEVLNLIFINDNQGPWNVLNKLIQFIDSENFNIEEDDNFQESYSYFGVLILGILTIIETFNIDISNTSIMNSYTIDYINNFYYRHCDNLTSQVNTTEEEELTIISNYNNLINEWINSLFDDNNDGLSDELIKSINVKQIYKIIPIIYKQAIIATENGKINEDILNGGIDYLSQIFLVPCTLSVIKWLLNKIEIESFKSTFDTKSHLWIKILFEILKSNLGDSINDGEFQFSNDESNLIFKIVLKISGSSIIEILTRFPLWNNVELIKKIVNIVQKTIDPNYKKQSFKITTNLNFIDELKLNLNNHNLVNQLISKIDKNELVRYLIKEFNNYQYNINNEDSKISINLLTFIILLKSFKSFDSKALLIKLFNQCRNELPNPSKIDLSFNITIDFNFSVIFNDPNLENSEDDDLFNESPSKFQVKDHYNKITQLNTGLYQFVKIYQIFKNNLDSVFQKTLAVLKNKFINEYDLFL